MFKTTFQLVLLVLLGLGSLSTFARADAPGDQYAVAAGHYAERRWKLAVEEFDAFLAAFPEHKRAARSHFFAGEALVQLGQFAKANEHFIAYLQSAAAGKFVKQATFRVGETSYLAGDDRSARDRLQAFRTAFPKDPLDAYALPYLAEIELRAKNNRLAEQLFGQALKNFSDGPLAEDCRFGLARAQRRLGKRGEAAALFRQLAANNQGLLADVSLFQLGTIEYGDRQYTEAIAIFETFGKKFPKSRLMTKAQYWLGLSYKGQQQWETAAEVLLSAIADNPDHTLVPAMRYQAADAMLYASKHEQAIVEFDRLIDRAPNSPWADDALLGKMLAGFRSGDDQIVHKLASQFKKQYPNSPLRQLAQQTSARSLIRSKQYAAATDLLRPLVTVEAEPHSRDLERYLLGMAYHHQRQYDEALVQYRAIAADVAEPLKGSLMVAQATTLSAVERYGEAVKLLEEYLTTHPKGPELPGSHAELAGCYAALGDWSSAKRHHKALLSFKPDLELTLSTSHRLAELAYRGGQRSWSAELFQSLAADGNPAEYVSKGLSGLAWSQLKQQDISNSAATFQRLIDQYPDSPLAAEAALARGKALERLGKPDAALAMYHWVLDQHSEAKQFPAALLAAALLHDRLKQQADAVRLFSQLLKEYPRHRKIDLATYQIAWIYRDQGKDSQADAMLHKIYQSHRKSRYWPDATYRLAEQAVVAKKYDRAEAYLLEVTKGKTSNRLLAHAHYLQGQIAITRGQWDRVEEPMRRIVEHETASHLQLQAEFWIAEAAYRNGEYDKASDRFKLLARKTTGRGDRWLAMIPLRRAQILAQNKKWDEADQLAKGIAAGFPDFKQQHEVDYLLGRCHASRAEFTEARKAYRRVTQSPRGAKTETAAMAQWMIGETWFHQKQYKNAIKQYLRVEILYKYPDWQAAALLQAGKCYEQLGDWQQATVMYSQLLSKYADTTHVEETERRLRVVQQRADAGKQGKR